jgi:hypothetical protein
MPWRNIMVLSEHCDLVYKFQFRCKHKLCLCFPQGYLPQLTWDTRKMTRRTLRRGEESLLMGNNQLKRRSTSCPYTLPHNCHELFPQDLKASRERAS